MYSQCTITITITIIVTLIVSLAFSNQSPSLQHSSVDMSINATDLTVDAMLRAFYKEKEHSEYFESLSQSVNASLIHSHHELTTCVRRGREERLAIHRHRGFPHLGTAIEKPA